MASSATLSGQFVTKRHKTWDAFTDRDGSTVEAGESLSVFIWTPHDDDLCEVKWTWKASDGPDALQPLRAALEAAASLTFGVETAAAVGDKTYGRYKGQTLRAARPVAAKAS